MSKVGAPRGNHNALRHGMYKSREYRSWQSMKGRVDNPRCDAYKNYGGRGITYCPEWAVFENFYADLGNRPEGMCLERIDNDGNYEPGNCTWATKADQNRNRRCCK